MNNMNYCSQGEVLIVDLLDHVLYKWRNWMTNQYVFFVVVVSRTGKQGYVQVDDRTAQHGQSPGRSVMVNTKGSIYLGMDLSTLLDVLIHVTVMS